MGYTFPDTVSIIKEHLESLGYNTYLYLSIDHAKSLPSVHIYKVGGSDAGPLATDRLVIDVYATGRDSAYTNSEQIKSALLGTSIFSEEYGLVDRVTTESSPADIPYASETVTKFTATYRADTRAL